MPGTDRLKNWLKQKKASTSPVKAVKAISDTVYTVDVTKSTRSLRGLTIFYCIDIIFCYQHGMTQQFVYTQSE